MSADEKARVKLITLLNVASGRQALSNGAEKRKAGEDWHEIASKVKAAKLAKAEESSSKKGKKAAVVAPEEASGGAGKESAALNGENVAVTADAEDAGESPSDPFKIHFATETSLLSRPALEAAKESKWRTEKATVPGLGKVVKSRLDIERDDTELAKPVMNPRLKEKLDDYIADQDTPTLPTELLQLIANYKDLMYSRMDFNTQDNFRAVLSLHAMSHIQKTRQRILKDNEALASKGGDTDRETRDQGFTRPKIENNSRFQKEFSLPEGAIDKLATDERDTEGQSKYPRDHRETFMGNIDDSFRVGLKVTRKSLKLYSEFYQSDLIIASPLGLRMSIEKEKSADFLSSIEIMVADQLDVMGMQNWEHVQFIFKHLNKIPGEAHGCDFSRVKPWYLNGEAAHLRQTVLLSAYETPEQRSLYNKQLVNVAGKYKSEQAYEGVLGDVRPGVKQTFFRIEAQSVQSEDDARFEYFTTKTLPALRRSAVASSSTIIFIPSYFDFVRVNAHLKTLEDFDYAVLSEYSSNSEISRARTNFFNGKKSFLVITERFHFFRRYKIRGARTVVFYAPPEHAAFYAEYLQYPFLKREVQKGKKVSSDGEKEMTMESLEASEVSCQTVFSKYDFLRLERIVGTEDARRMSSKEEGEKFSFV